MKKHFLLAFIISVSIFACKNRSSNTQNTESNTQSILEKLEEPVEPKEYRASYKKINDLLHTKLEISFSWDSCFAFGKATLSLKPYFYPSNTLELDAKGFVIKEVSNPKTREALKYTYDGKKLKIDLGKTYTRNEKYDVFIDYIAQPNKLKAGGSAAIAGDKGLYFINPDKKEKNKPQQIWTQGETESNSCWMPTIDGPGEKHTQEIAITVDNKFKTLSNGTLVYSTLNGNGTRTDNWKMELPHSTYLTMMAIGEYAIVHDKWRDMEVNYYVEPEFEKNAMEIFGNTPEMIEVFSNKLGVDYPWDKYSQVVARDYVSGAMENTSATLHGEFVQVNHRQYLDAGRGNEDVISHELFHQWFGDLVTTESWSNLPLNESFATYGEYIWAEHKYGRDAADLIGQNNLSAYLGSAANRAKDIVRLNYSDKEDMFDVVTYQKGGRVLHMLRKYVGDDAFFASLKLYLEKNKFKSAEMHNLRLAFEETTGEDLNWFFNQWFFNHGHPELTIVTSYNDSSKMATIDLKQTQNLKENPLYILPMDVDVYVNGTKSRSRITMTKQNETFEIACDAKPDLINVDAENMLLGLKTEFKKEDAYIFQFKNAPLYLDRYEALKGLAKPGVSEIKAQEIIVAALSDPFYFIRREALGKVKYLSEALKNQAFYIVSRMANADENSGVRATAIAVLGSEFADKDIASVLEKATADSSYGVVASTLKVFSKTDKNKAKAIAKKNENEKSGNLGQAIADLYSKEGGAEENNFYINYLDNNGGYAPLFILNYYKTYLLRQDKNTVKDGLAKLIELSTNSTIGFVKNTAKGVISTIQKKYQEINDDTSASVESKSEATEVLEFIKSKSEN